MKPWSPPPGTPSRVPDLGDRLEEALAPPIIPDPLFDFSDHMGAIFYR